MRSPGSSGGHVGVGTFEVVAEDDLGVGTSSNGLGGIGGSVGAQGLGQSQVPEFEEKLIESLVRKIMTRLPHRSGRKGFVVDTDELVRQALDSLSELCKFKLAFVVHALTLELEQLTRPPMAIGDEPIPLETLHSQLLVLRILAACMWSHWSHLCSQNATNGHPRESVASTPVASKDLPDPPPLEDGLAKRLVVAISFFLRQNSVYEESQLSGAPLIYTTTSSSGIGGGVVGVPFQHNQNASPQVHLSPHHPHALSHMTSTQSLRTAASFSPSGKMGAIGNHPNPSLASQVPNAADANLNFVPTVASNEETAARVQEVMSSIMSNAAGILFYVSASNWHVVFAKLKNRIAYYAGPEENPDLSEAALLKFCSLNRERLGAVLQEFQSNFSDFKKHTHYAMAVVLRESIWRWIETFPSEFAALNASNRRLEGGPENLFDVTFSHSDNTKRKPYAWPLMMMLLVTCPDIVSKLAVGESTRQQGISKKSQYLEGLRKSFKSTKLADVAATCYVDLCMAAAYVPPADLDSGREPSGLRSLAMDVASDLKTKIFDSATAESPDVQLITSALAALYRLDRKTMAQSVSPAVLSESSCSHGYKLAVVQACLVLAGEDSPLSWNPGVVDLAVATAGPIRTLFIETAMKVPVPDDVTATTSLPSTIRRGAKVPIRKPYAEELSERNELLSAILRLWRTDYRTLLYRLVKPQSPPSAASESDEQQMSQILTQLVKLLHERTSGAFKMDALHAIMDIFAMASGNELDTVSCVDVKPILAGKSSVVCVALARQVIDARDSAESEMNALQIFQAFLKQWTQWATEGLAGQPSPEVWIAIEIACCMAACSPSAEQVTLAQDALQQAGALRAACGINDDGSPEAGSVITAAMGASRGQAVGGRIAQQKRMRRSLRNLSGPTSAVLACWDEALCRWRHLSRVIGHQPFTDDDSDAGGSDLRVQADQSIEDAVSEWINYSGFLVALCSHCSIMTGASDHLAGLIAEGSWPLRFAKIPNRPSNVDRFIQEMVDLLVADDARMREAVKDALGSDLSPSLFPILFKHLKSIVVHFFDDIPGAKEPYTHFIDQAVAMLRLIFDRVSEPFSSDASATVEDLLLDFSKYIHRLGTSASALRTKTRMCQLCEALLTKQNTVQSGHDPVFRNALLEHLENWASESKYTGDSGHNRTCRELDIACLRCLVPLLDGLVLFTSNSQSDADGNVKTDRRRFHRYYLFFSAFFERISRSEAAVEDMRKSGSAESSRDQPKEIIASRVLSDLASMRELVVQALSNMLRANIDPGYVRLVDMGYSQDPATRQALLQVLSNVARTAVQYPAYSQYHSEEAVKQLIQLMCEPGLTLALAVCEACTGQDYEEMTEILLGIFDSKRVIKFLKAVIEKEVAETDHESTLFRGNSFATRLLTAFARARGYHYLRSTLRDLLISLCRKPREYSVEFDPHMPTPDDDTAARNLESVTEAFLQVIAVSYNKMPLSIRDICHHIFTVVQDKFPESVFTAIGGFIFLRFINPAIVTPETIDLDLPNQGREIRRGLVMITKVLQALANNIRFGAKEPGMRTLNNFMEKNILPMTRFLKDIAAPVPVIDDLADDVREEEGLLQPGLDEGDREVLLQFLYHNHSKIGTFLLRPSSTKFRHWHDGTEVLSTSTGQETWRRLTDILSCMGSPARDDFGRVTRVANQFDQPEIEAPDLQLIANAEIRASTDAASWASYLKPGPLSKKNVATFQILARELDAENGDLESLACHVLDCLEKVKSPFGLFIDCIQFESKNEVPIGLLQRFLHLVPVLAARNFTSVFLYYPNTAVKRYLRRFQHVFQAAQLDRKIIPITSREELGVHFDEAIEDIPGVLDAFSCRIARELRSPRSPYNHIVQMQHYKTQNPVLFKLSDQTLVITSGKKRDLYLDIKSTLTDVVELVQIKAVRRLSRRTDGDEFIIELKDSNSVMHFVNSNTRRDVIEAITTAMVLQQRSAENEMSAPRSVKRSGDSAENPRSFSSPRHRPSRIIGPDDITGSLLNIALFNLCQDHASTRLAAYNLAVTLLENLKLSEVPELVRCARGLYVPSNHLQFVAGLSEKLAAAVPKVALSFLSELFVALESAHAEHAAIYIHCVRPWIPHLAQFTAISRDEAEATQLKLRRLFRSMIEVSCRGGSLAATMQSRVWPTIERIEAYIPMILDELVKAATQSEVGSADFEKAISVVGAFSSIVTRGKLLSRLRQTIARTSLRSKPSLTESREWPEIAALTRMELTLSFNAVVQTEVFLPEICHVVTMIAGTGPSVIRSSVYSIVINLVHSLLTRTGGCDLVGLASLAEKLTEPRFEHSFGLTASENAKVAENGREIKEFLPPGGLKEIVDALLTLLTAGASSTDLSNAWRARWMSLVTSTCFQYNRALQHRAFVALGQLADGETEDDLFFQLLTALKSSIKIEGDATLAMSIITCLGQVLEGLPARSRYWTQIFWASVALLQVGHPQIFAASVALASKSLAGLVRHGYFESGRFSEVMLELRVSQSPQFGEVAMTLDEEIGLRFDHNFSFAIAGLLAKGLRGSTSEATATLLGSFLSQASRPSDIESEAAHHNDQVHPQATGYFVVLLPYYIRLGKLKDLFQIADLTVDPSVEEADAGRLPIPLLDKLVIGDEETALLITSLVTAMIQVAEVDSEKLVLYGLLAEMTVLYPDIAGLMYFYVFPQLHDLLASSENLGLLELAQRVMLVFMSRSNPSSSNTNGAGNGNMVNNRDPIPFLESLGFSSLIECGSFAYIHNDPELQGRLARLCIALLNDVLSQ